MYGLTIENEKLICEKATKKKDGCYRFRGVAYRVQDGIVTHYAADCKILERCYGFNVVIGEYEFGLNSSEKGQKILKEIKNN